MSGFFGFAARYAAARLLFEAVFRPGPRHVVQFSNDRLGFVGQEHRWPADKFGLPTAPHLLDAVRDFNRACTAYWKRGGAPQYATEARLWRDDKNGRTLLAHVRLDAPELAASGSTRSGKTHP